MGKEGKAWGGKEIAHGAPPPQKCSTMTLEPHLFWSQKIMSHKNKFKQRQHWSLHIHTPYLLDRYIHVQQQKNKMQCTRGSTIQWACMSPEKCPFPRWSRSQYNIWLPGPTRVCPVLAIFHSSPVCPTHRHFCSNRLHLCIACRQCGLTICKKIKEKLNGWAVNIMQLPNIQILQLLMHPSEIPLQSYHVYLVSRTVIISEMQHYKRVNVWQ